MARLRGLVGEGQVGTPELRNTHRPDSFVMRAFAPHAGRSAAEAPGTYGGGRALLCLRRFRPPRYAQVIVVNRQPVRIVSPSVSGRVVIAKGPWRTSGDWWRDAGEEAGAWNRDEWDVALESGALYRLFHDATQARWFIEGSYD